MCEADEAGFVWPIFVRVSGQGSLEGRGGLQPCRVASTPVPWCRGWPFAHVRSSGHQIKGRSAEKIHRYYAWFGELLLLWVSHGSILKIVKAF
jgi:hypothetical protein